MSGAEASELVGALEVVWGAIQDRHGDVPDVMVTLGAGSLGVPRGSLKLGHFAADRWTSPTSTADPARTPAATSTAELFVGGEGLARGPESVLATLLHEAAHGVAHVRRVADTSRQGRYHNRRFKALAEELGLVVHEVPGIGWSGTDLAPGTAQTYQLEVAGLGAAIRTWRHLEGRLPGPRSPGDGPDDPDGDHGGDGSAGPGTGARRPKNGLVLVCGCRRRIRASTTTADAGPILCGLCATAFTPA